MRHVQALNSYIQPDPLYGTEQIQVQEPKRIHVIVEYMSFLYPRSAVGLVLDCFHMPGRGQGSRWWRKRAGCRSCHRDWFANAKGCAYTIQADLNQPRVVNDTVIRRTVSSSRWVHVRSELLETCPSSRGFVRCPFTVVQAIVNHYFVP